MDFYATTRQRVLGNYFDERRTTLYGSEVKVKKHALLAGYHACWLDLVLVESAGDDPGKSTRDIILLPHTSKFETSDFRPAKAISLSAVQYAFREQSCEMTAVYPNSVRYTIRFANDNEMACWKAEIHQAQHITFDDYSEIMFHIVTVDDSPFHAILKTSRVDSTALVAVDPINFKEIQVWSIPSLISLTVNYNNGVSLTFSYIDPIMQEFNEDEVRIFSKSPVVMGEVKPFLDGFLKLRLGDLYVDIKIEQKRFNPDQSAVASCISEFSELKYIFPRGQTRSQSIPLHPRSPVTLPPGRSPRPSLPAIPAPRQVKSFVGMPPGQPNFGTFPHRRAKANTLSPSLEIHHSISSDDIKKAFSNSSPSQRRLPFQIIGKLPPANLIRPGVAPER